MSNIKSNNWTQIKSIIIHFSIIVLGYFSILVLYGEHWRMCDFKILHAFLYNPTYNIDNYIYLPSFLPFLVLYISYDIFRIEYFILLFISIVLMEKLRIEKYQYYVLIGILIYCFYIDIERGNSNLILYNLCLLAMICLDKFRNTNNRKYLIYTLTLIVIASYKIHAILFVLIPIYYLFEKNQRRITKEIVLSISIFTLLFLIMQLSYFVFNYNEFALYLMNFDEFNIGKKINSFFESNQFIWLNLFSIMGINELKLKNKLFWTIFCLISMVLIKILGFYLSIFLGR